MNIKRKVVESNMIGFVIAGVLFALWFAVSGRIKD